LKKTLLLADDSPTIQKVINLTFADEGIDVIAVSDGNAAIQQLRELKPDLVMADVHMPGLNGYQICERIRQNAELSNVPVILLVGSFEPFDEEEAIRVGADDFLMKPFQSIRQLVSRVAALLEPGAHAKTMPVAVSEAPAIEETPVTKTAVFEEPAAEIETPAPDMADTAATQNPAIGPSEWEETPATIFQTPSITPQDIFHSPWSDTYPDVSNAAAAEISEAEEISETESFTQEPQATESRPGHEITDEVNELADFDLEFDNKFPDAAALSSENSFEDLSSVLRFDGTPAAPEAAEVFEERKEEATEVAVQGETGEEIVEYTPPMSESMSEAGLTNTFSEQPVERVLDGDHIGSSVEDDDSTLILDLGGLMGEPVSPAENVFSEIQLDEFPAAESKEIEEYKEAEKVIDMAAPVQEFDHPVISEPVVSEPEEPAAEPAKFDFREADAFDDDLSIEESFHGLPKPEPPPMEPPQIEAPMESMAVEAPPVSFTEPAEPVEPAENFENAAPLERIMDTEPGHDTGEVSADQSDGSFTVPAAQAVNAAAAPVSGPEPAAEPPQQQMTSEAIEAIAQRVSEKLLEKLVRNLAPDMKNLIISEIAGGEDKNE
jgi:CheY-like chemotaxis protein